ncbi:unnamed protein product [Phytophthora fragariaefolia]|uniref:Unnamed protein product n=1 Tax=Phytophthora fragariaefolia TaxID=1490495 RepID=A0A9W6YLQ3_9STRA|nr:unnamed protein product [Phytophthora fragariaefolia]
MKCAKIDCHWGDLAETAPCSVCGRQVHYLCSNELSTKPDVDLSKSLACIRKFFNEDSESQELTPSSTSGISCASDATVTDLAQAEVEREPEPTHGVPSHITHKRPDKAIDPVWDFIHVLGEPVMHRGSTYTHIYLLCLQRKTWKLSLCRAANASNAKSHLVSSHKDHEMAVPERQHRVQRADRYKVQVATKPETKPETKLPVSQVPTGQVEKPVKRQKTLWKAAVTQHQISGHIARWLIRDGLAHNVVTTPAFRDFLIGVTGDPNVTIPARETYNDIVDNHFEQFTGDVTEMLIEEFEDLDETPFMTVSHDLWTNSAKNSIVAVSEEVSKLMDKQLKARYGLDMEKMARFTISDTAPAALKVSRQFDTTLQTDCAMHALNLCIGYGIGLKENVRNVYKLDPKTQIYAKTRVVVTEGGAFPEGGKIIRKLRALNNFFANKSPERAASLIEVHKFHKLPQLAPLVDVDVRVTSTIKLFQRSIVNYPAFQTFFQNADVSKDEKHVFNRISSAEWELVVQMEAIMQRVAELALVESQSDTMLASARMNSYKFSSYCLNGPRDPETNEKNFPRTQMKLNHLSELGQRCIKRTLHQIAERLLKPSVPMAMALLLGPRTKPAAKTFLRIPDTTDAGLYANDEHENNAVAFTSTLAQSDGNNSSENESELSFGDEVSQPATETTAEATLNTKADALLDEWLNFRADWAEVAKLEFPTKVEQDKVMAKLSVLDRKRNVRVWNVEQVCGSIDVCRWFAEVGPRTTARRIVVSGSPTLLRLLYAFILTLALYGSIVGCFSVLKAAIKRFLALSHDEMLSAPRGQMTELRMQLLEQAAEVCMNCMDLRLENKMALHCTQAVAAAKRGEPMEFGTWPLWCVQHPL